VSNFYWSTIASRRVSRRRTLAGAGGVALGAAFLAACGGSDSGGSGAGDNKAASSGVLTTAVETSKQAKRDGIMKDRTYSDVPTLSVATGGSSPHNAVGPLVYSSMLQTKPGVLKPSENEIAADLIESWEWAPDGLTITMKMRQGVKWHNKAPVNGRALDIDDIMQTWNRFVKGNGARVNVVNAVNPQAPVLSLTATDARTLVMKLSEPQIYVLEFFASSNASSGLAIASKESDGGFDSRQEMIGTGPYVLDSYKPSQGFTFKRNPEYYAPDDALLAQIDMPIVPEYAAALAQFKAGNIYSFGSYSSAPKITADDILPVVREDKRIAVYQGDQVYPAALGGSRRIMAFGWLPDGKSPMMDERVRQAISMSWDRDLYTETLFNVANFTKEGMAMETRWDTHVSAQTEGWWLDPKGKDFGANGKYFKHDLAEAKKLLAAAGFPNGFDVQSNYVTGPELPTAKHAEIIDGFHRELGLKPTVHGIDYAKEYQPKYRDGHGQFEGYAWMTNVGSGPVKDATAVLASEFYSKGGATSFKGFSTTGKNDQAGDPQVNAMIEKGRVERDTEKRRAIVFELQRYLAKSMYSLSSPGTATNFAVAWPCIGNFNVYRGARPNYRLWIDQTKAPFKTS
jgi:peptide/nickel transport system substrate-binding protein